jgi:hypothetical protein
VRLVFPPLERFYFSPLGAQVSSKGMVRMDLEAIAAAAVERAAVAAADLAAEVCMLPAATLWHRRYALSAVNP